MRLLLVLLFGVALAQIPVTVPTDLEKTALLQLRESNKGIFLASANFSGWNAPDVEINFNTTNFCLWTGVLCGQNGITQLIIEKLGLTSIPPSVYSNFLSAAIFRFSANAIAGSIPTNFQVGMNRIAVNRIDLSNNSLAGPIPTQFCIPNVISVSLANNKLTGSIPSNIGNMGALWDLNLSNNLLTGEIPESLGNVRQLDTLDLSGNQLVGSIPSSFTNLTQLKFLDLSNNQLTGPIPDFKYSPGLTSIKLQGNRFDGLVPTFLSTYTEQIDFAGAAFRCPIPACAPGVNCVLRNVQCTCPCNETLGGSCVEGSLRCNCLPHRFGVRCQDVCVGTVQTPYGNAPCNGHGDCFNGPEGDGTCTCFPGYGGNDCSLACPGAPNNTCSGNGRCNREGKCECFGNKGGTNCFGCIPGWAGSTCQIECRGGSENPCSGNGACNDGVLGDGNCACYNGFEGGQCEVNIELKSSKVDGWLVFGIIIIILFVFAIVAIAVVVYLYYRTRRSYEELSNRALPRTELQEFTRDNGEDKTKGYKEKKEANKIPSI